MASMRFLARNLPTGRVIVSCIRTLPPSLQLAPLLPRLEQPPSLRSFEHAFHSYAGKGQYWQSVHEISSVFYIPAILAGLLGLHAVDVAHADSDEADAKSPSPQESPSSYVELEEIAKKERSRLEELLKSKGMKHGFVPRFIVAVKGQKVTIKFHVPPTFEFPLIIANLVSLLGVKIEENGTGSDMALRAWNSGVAWQLALTQPKKKSNDCEGDLCILMFCSLITSDKAEIEFIKQGSFSNEELDALVSILQLVGQQKTIVKRPRGDVGQTQSTGKIVSSLASMGIRIYGINGSDIGSSKTEISWDNIAGYHQQKREIEDTILLALQSPEVYDDIARGTRCKFESNRPRAVLFEGPPGTGKTSCARVIAKQAGVPMICVPLEAIMSKYYGESERLLGKVFSLANDLPNGAIIFLDEVDSFAIARDNEMHEATRRLLSVLLGQIDGFEQEKKVVVVAATNRKQDLDPALVSRFDSMITFGLPDQQTRKEIASQYAKHLTKNELNEFATFTEEMSGRDIKDVCQQAERHWASKIIRGHAQKENGSLPPLQEYIDSAMNRQKSLQGIARQNQNVNRFSKKPQFDFV